MKKLYRSKGAVHPSPQPDLLAFLPAAILAMTLALSPQEKEVLAYLIQSSSSGNFSRQQKGGSPSPVSDHPSSFSCSCFRCYMSYWIKWDSSPNREKIHEIIDAFEESCVKGKKKEKSKSKKQRRKGKSLKDNAVIVSEMSELNELSESTSSELSLNSLSLSKEVSLDESVVDEEEASEAEEEEMEKGGSVRRLVSFLGERIWSVWG